MLKFLNFREKGLHDPLTLKRAETTRRATNLELSQHKDIQRIHSGTVNSLDIDLIENRYLLSGGADGYIAIHDLYNSTGAVKHTCESVAHVGLSNRHRHKFSVECVLWYPLDTGIFISSGTDKLLKVWDTNRLKPADEYEFSGIVFCHDMSPVATKHCLIAVGSNSSTLKLVDLKSGSSTHMLKGHRQSVMAVKWAPHNEFQLASGSLDNRVFLWDIRNAKGSLLVFDQYNGKPPNKPKANYTVTSHNGPVNGLEFTADGLHLVSLGTDQRVNKWNTSTGKNTMTDYTKVHNSGKRHVQFAISNGSTSDLIYMPHRSEIDVWDINTGEEIDRLRGHYSLVNGCIFRPDYQELYSAGSDRNILVWEPEMNMKSREVVKTREKTQESQREVTVSEQRTAPTADSWSSDEET